MHIYDNYFVKTFTKQVVPYLTKVSQITGYSFVLIFLVRRTYSILSLVHSNFKNQYSIQCRYLVISIRLFGKQKSIPTFYFPPYHSEESKMSFQIISTAAFIISAAYMVKLISGGNTGIFNCFYIPVNIVPLSIYIIQIMDRY